MKRFIVVLSLIASPALAQIGPVPAGGAGSIGSGTSLTSCTSSILYADASSLLKCDPAAVVNGSVSTAGRSILTIKDTISGASATSNFLNITGTFPATLSAETSGALVSITGDNDAQIQSGLKAIVTGSTTSNIYAVYGVANAASTNAGGVRGDSTGAAPRGVGVWGTSSSTGAIGGFFGIGSAAPQSASYALGADNGNAAQDIFRAMDNGTAVFTIADGGIVLTPGAANFTAPQYAASTATTTGFGYNTSDLNHYYASSGAGLIEIGPNAGAQGFSIKRNASCNSNSTSCGYNFSAGPGNTVDAFITSEAAAVIQLGFDVNGAAVNQTLKAHDGITGTDIKGASITLSPGLGTGAAVSNPLTLNRVVTKATGTTAQTYSPAIITCPTKILSNTSATAQTIATITTTSTTGGSVTMDYSVVANNGTLQDTDGGMVKVAWNNNAGTVAAAMTAVALQADSDASGTLATTPTATVATNVVSIKFTPTWVTIVPTTVTGWATFTLHTSGDTVVCQ